MAAIVTGLAFSLQPNSLLEVLALIKSNPSMLLLNAAPVLLVMLLAYSMIGNAWASSALGSTVFLGLSLVNRYKIEFRDEPLVPLDLSLIREANGMVTEGGFEISYLLIATIVGFIAVQVLLAFWMRQDKPLRIQYKVLGLVTCLTVMVMSNTHIYSKAETYNSLRIIGNQFNVTKQYNSRGFIYSFIYNLSAFKVEKPSNYKKEAVESWIADYSNDTKIPKATNAPASSKKPHVIMVMAEAFTDFTNETDLRFTKKQDPLRFYNSLKGKQVLKGHIIVPTYGGGTANTEYESLTGGANLYLNKSITTAYSLIRKDTPALPSELKNLGYETVGMHPGYSWFYNRQNVYSNFGFQKTYFEDQFTQKKKGVYLAEDITIDKMIEVFETHQKSSQNPLFEFCVTIQNHGPYDDEGHYKDEKVDFKTDKTLTAESAQTLSNYLVGLRDADRQLERLVNYFEDINEPVVLVYFGDHLPYLGEDYKAFKELGYPLSSNGSTTERLNAYKTPFFVWKNDAAKDSVDLNAIKLPENNTMNAGYLAGLVFELIGEKNTTPYMAFLNEMRTVLPVFRGSEFNFEGKNVDILPPDSKGAEYLNKLVHWQYYKLK